MIILIFYLFTVHVNFVILTHFLKKVCMFSGKPLIYTEEFVNDVAL
jgi:hypothetical protein